MALMFRNQLTRCRSRQGINISLNSFNFVAFRHCEDPVGMPASWAGVFCQVYGSSLGVMSKMTRMIGSSETLGMRSAIQRGRGSC